MVGIAARIVRARRSAPGAADDCGASAARLEIVRRTTFAADLFVRRKTNRYLAKASRPRGLSRRTAAAASIVRRPSGFTACAVVTLLRRRAGKIRRLDLAISAHRIWRETGKTVACQLAARSCFRVWRGARWTGLAGRLADAGLRIGLGSLRANRDQLAALAGLWIDDRARGTASPGRCDCRARCAALFAGPCRAAKTERMAFVVDAAHLLAWRALHLLFGRLTDITEIRHVLLGPTGLTNRWVEDRRLTDTSENAFPGRRRAAADTFDLAGIVRIVGRTIETKSAEILTLCVHFPVRTPGLALAIRVRRSAFRTTLESGLLLIDRATEVRRWWNRAATLRPHKPAWQHPAAA